MNADLDRMIRQRRPTAEEVQKYEETYSARHPSRFEPVAHHAPSDYGFPRSILLGRIDVLEAELEKHRDQALAARVIMQRSLSYLNAIGSPGALRLARDTEAFLGIKHRAPADKETA